MTPSAARGIIESIYWHPGMRWVIDRIRVCNPIQFINFKRNEVVYTINASDVRKAMFGGKEDLYMPSHSSGHIIQRAAMILKDVHYVIDAHFEMTDKAAPGDNSGKFQEITTRRIEKGQCYHQPCFGAREYPAKFQKCVTVPECPPELRGKHDLGWMLFDMDYSNKENIKPMFFRAVMVDGVIDVPAPDSEGVLH